MEVLDIKKISCNRITTFFRKNNYYFRYGKYKLKFKLVDICISNIENSKYTNKMHIKFRLDPEHIKDIVALEDHIYGTLNIEPKNYKSILNGQILDSKVIERYKKFEIDIFDSNANLITMSELKENEMVDSEFELRNIWKLDLNGIPKYGIIVVIHKIALRRNK
jgi:hypothetical protein